MLPYLIAGAIGYGIAKLFEDETPKYADGGSVLLAPNGKPSNLTPEQYKLVRTKAFKQWFGDWENNPENSSKVVDENGEPLMVIHKTNSENDFYIFDKNKIGDTNSFTTLNGFFFGNYKKQSDNLRNILCFLNIKNPIILNQSNTYFDSVGYQEAVQHFIQNGTTDYLVEYLEYEEYDDEEINEILDNWEYADGVVVKNLYYDNFDTEFVSFEPNQIKLADGTNTTFDSNNPDIRFDGGGSVKSDAFKKWFGNSKVVDKKGNPLIVYHGSPDLRGLKEKYIFESRFLDNQSFFFTDNYSMAKSYADPKRAFDYQNAEEGVIGLYLSLQNPLIVNAFNQIWRKFETTIDGNEIIGTRNIINFAKKKGYDSVIVENVRDYYNNNDKKTKGGNVYVAFYPNQIKLANGSNTTFDGNNPDIRFDDGGKVLSYNDVLKKQQTGDYYFDILFSNKNSKFVEETIDIKKLRELNGFSDDEDEIVQTISYFNDLGMDEDYEIGRELMNKIVDGVELSPIVVDEEYKVLDGSHRLSAYSELYYYYSYDFPFDGKLKIYKRISN